MEIFQSLNLSELESFGIGNFQNYKLSELFLFTFEKGAQSLKMPGIESVNNQRMSDIKRCQKSASVRNHKVSEIRKCLNLPKMKQVT